MKDKSLLIVGHGSKSPEAQEIFSNMTELVASKGEYKTVRGAHMELAKPSIEDVVAEMNADGITEVIVVPYFLYKGIHIKEDIPEILEKLSNEYTNMTFKMADPIGYEPLLADILLKRASEIS